MLALPLMALFPLTLLLEKSHALTDITAVTANLLSTDSEAGQLSYNANDDIWTLTAGDTTVFFEQSQISSNVGITVNGVVSANAFAGSGAALTILILLRARVTISYVKAVLSSSWPILS